MSKTRMTAVLGILIAAGLISHPRTGSATPVPGALAIGNAIAADVEAVRWRGRGWHGGWGGFGAGLAAGAIVGGLLAAPYYRRPYYDGPAYYYYDDPGVDAVEYCIRRFRSYDPYSGTYLGYDGYRHPCP
jgi:hypothetical protein